MTEASFMQNDTKKSKNISKTVTHVGCNDILLGAAGRQHAGNIYFQRLIDTRKEDFYAAKKIFREGIVREVVDEILENDGRFLKCGENGWEIVDKLTALVETKQFFRDKKKRSRVFPRNGNATPQPPQHLSAIIPKYRRQSYSSDSWLLTDRHDENKSTQKIPELRDNDDSLETTDERKLFTQLAYGHRSMPTTRNRSCNATGLIKDDNTYYPYGNEAEINGIHKGERGSGSAVIPSSCTNHAFALQGGIEQGMVSASDIEPLPLRLGEKQSLCSDQPHRIFHEGDRILADEKSPGDSTEFQDETWDQVISLLG